MTASRKDRQKEYYLRVPSVAVMIRFYLDPELGSVAKVHQILMQFSVLSPPQARVDQ